MTSLSEVVETSVAVRSTRSRSAKIALLAALLRSVEAEEIAPVVAFLSGEPRQGKFGVGYAAVFGVEVGPSAGQDLAVADLDAALDRLETTLGRGSQADRAEILGRLLSRATLAEQEFIRRLLTGELRQGALDGIMIEAIAAAAGVPPSAVRRAVMLGGTLGPVARTALEGGALDRFALEVMRPVLPMLAATAASVETALAAIGAAVVEWKLDGVRIQAHRIGDQVRIFTRNLNEVTARVPALVRLVAGLAVERVVLDGEAMSVDPKGRPRPFPETMSLVGTDAPAEVAPIIPFFFDVLHLDGQDLIDRPLTDRLTVLDRVVPEPYRIPRLLTDQAGVAAGFLADALAQGQEGVMVKAPGSVYEAGRRGGLWLKVKPAHTLDLAILAAEWGHGRRTGWLSNLHLGAYDPATGGFVMLGKTFKGLTDKMLAWQTERLLELEEHRTQSTVYVRPELIAEIAFDGVLASPRYPGGMSLRFARVKSYRLDKSPEDADAIETVRAVFEGRSVLEGRSGGGRPVSPHPVE